MRVYTISYDLMRPVKDYDGLISELERLGAVRILFSQWALRSTSTAIALRDHLKRYIDNDDRLLVTEIVQDNWASWNVKLKEAIAA